MNVSDFNRVQKQRKYPYNLSCHEVFDESKKITRSKLKRLAASHQRALVQVHFPSLDQVGKTNQTKLQKMNSTPMCTGAGSFLVLGLSGENQPNRTAEKEISHQRALVQVYFSCLDQAGKTNMKSSVGKEIQLLHTTDPLSLRQECLCLKLNHT